MPARRVTDPTNWRITKADERKITGEESGEVLARATVTTPDGSGEARAPVSMIRDRLSDVHVRAAGASSIIEGDVNPR